MKALLIAAAVIAVAVAGPTQRIVMPGIAGPAPVIDSEGSPISVGPAIVDSFEPIAVGPAIVDSQPISVGPAIVDSFQPISVGPAIVGFPVSADGTVIPETPDVAPVVVPPVQPSSAPLVQIILNINQPASDVATAPVVAVPLPEPVSIVDAAPEPVSVVEIAEPQPVVVGTPVLPQPVVNLPEILN